MDYSNFSIDELLDELYILEMELESGYDYLPYEDIQDLSDMIGKVDKELSKRGYYDREKEKEMGMINSWKEDKDNWKDCFDGLDEGDDDYGNLPF